MNSAEIINKTSLIVFSFSVRLAERVSRMHATATAGEYSHSRFAGRLKCSESEKSQQLACANTECCFTDTEYRQEAKERSNFGLRTVWKIRSQKNFF